MRRFDVDDGVEGLIGKRQVFRIALDEVQTRDGMPLPAEADAGRIKVEPGVACGTEGAREVGRRRLLTAGAALGGLALAGCASTPSGPSLGRVVVIGGGFGGSMVVRYFL